MSGPCCVPGLSRSFAVRVLFSLNLKPSKRRLKRYAARLVTDRRSESGSETGYQEVDVSSLELVRPRSVGVEHVGLTALTWLKIPDVLGSIGMNARQRAYALGSIVGRMAQPGSELATWHWLTHKSALGELIETDFEGLPLMGLYRASDMLVRHRQTIEAALFTRINELFSLETTVTLYDLTNTYFEGEVSGNAKAKRGHSKEKRFDCPLVTLGLVLDGSGFVRRSRMFEGNVSEAGTLEGMLKGLGCPDGAMVIMDRGIATQANIDWLIKHHFRYLVVSREKNRRFDVNQAVTTTTAKEETIKIQRVDDGKEARLYCYSEQRQEKESAIERRFTKRFEQGLTALAKGLHKPRGMKDRDKLAERIGRLKEKSHGIGQHYTITITYDKSGKKARSLTWEKTPLDGTRLTHPGVYCLRTNELTWDEATLWQTYTMLTDLEAVFRSLKSELGLRPVFHHKEARTEGHLFITVLAYQAVQTIRNKLGGCARWTTLRKTLSIQQRVTATFKQRDGRTLHIRKATVAEKNLQEIYDKLGITATPGGVHKLTM
jgi:transposase